MLNKIGNAFAFVSALALGLFMWYCQPSHGYTEAQRENMDQVFASAEYEARKADIIAGIEPLSVADLK